MQDCPTKRTSILIFLMYVQQITDVLNFFTRITRIIINFQILSEFIVFIDQLLEFGHHPGNSDLAIPTKINVGTIINKFIVDEISHFLRTSISRFSIVFFVLFSIDLFVETGLFAIFSFYSFSKVKAQRNILFS